MIHYGDVQKINGAKVPMVDVITFGAPCQDLSVAGKRAGMKNVAMGDEETTRSGLFFEAIRIIKEMRNESFRQLSMRGTDVDIRLVKPRYAVYENVPGAFSSNGGADFQAVLEETAKVAKGDASIPGFEKWGGRWPSSGAILGDGWSIAWRVHDAQFWGVPQRRKRIALVADFGGQTAPEILFERKSVSGDTEQGEQARQEATASVGRGTNPSSYTLKVRGGREIDSKGHKAGKGALVQTELSGTLGVSQDQTLITTSDGSEVAGTLDASYYKGCGLRQGKERTVVYGISAYESNSMKSSNPDSGIYEADTTRTLDNNGGNPACNQGGMIVLEGNGSRPSHKGKGYVEGEISYTLNSTEQHAICIENHPNDSRVKINENGIVQTLSGRMGTGGNNVPMVMGTYQKTVGSLCASGYDKLGTQEAANDMYVVQGQSWDGSQVSPTLTANNAGGAQRMPDKDNFNAVLTYGLDRASFNQGKNAQYDFAIEEEKIGTQVAKGLGAVCQSIVRRLTPMECERLQGFPDHWTDIGEWVDTKGKVHKDVDSPRYKALGNSIALPFWEWMAVRMRAYLSYPCTMASLFDGIGGFPLVFSRCGVKPVWASEIEEFPIAVTKKRFPEMS